MTYVEALVLAFARHQTNKESELRSSTPGQRKWKNVGSERLPVTRNGSMSLYMSMVAGGTSPNNRSDRSRVRVRMRLEMYSHWKQMWCSVSYCHSVANGRERCFPFVARND